MLLAKLFPIILLLGTVNGFNVNPVQENADDAAKLYRWYSLLGDFRKNYKVMIVNQIGIRKQMGILKRLTAHKFSYYQDTPNLNIWEGLNGGKDDVFIYDTQGTLVKHIKSRPDDDDEPNSYMGSGKELCEDAESIATIKFLLEELKKIVKEDEMSKCNDENDKSYEEIYKLRNAPMKKKLTAEERQAKKNERQAKKEMEKMKRKEERKTKQESRKMANKARKEERMKMKLKKKGERKTKKEMKMKSKKRQEKKNTEKIQ